MECVLRFLLGNKAMSSQDIAAGSSVWKLRGTRATCKTTDLVAQIDVDRPMFGLHNLVWKSESWSDHYLGVETREQELGASSELREVHIRGDDLVANYSEREKDAFSWQVYWSATEQPNSEVWLDAIVSVQTRLLESFPRVFFHSQLAGQECWLVSRLSNGNKQFTPWNDASTNGLTDCGCVVLRPAASRWSYAEMLHPDDPGTWHLQCVTDRKYKMQRSFEPAFLEKGVIRRMRGRAILLPREGDLQRAAECLTTFAAEDPPLTV